MIPLGTKLFENEVIHKNGVTKIIAWHKCLPMTIYIDTLDWPLVEPYSWHVERAKKTYYAKTMTGGKRKRLHSILYPNAPQVDHKDRNGLNNRRENLRPATNQQNNMNRGKLAGASCKYIGVSWDKTRQKFQAGIKINGKRIALGRFDSAEDAARVRDAKALDLFGDWASLNFPVTKEQP